MSIVSRISGIALLVLAGCGSEGSGGDPGEDAGGAPDAGGVPDAGGDAGAETGTSGGYLWHTFHGGYDHDIPDSIAVDGEGNAYVVGTSGSATSDDASWSGPDGEAPLHAFSGQSELFVLKLDTAGGYVWHTFYGSLGIIEGPYEDDGEDSGRWITYDSSRDRLLVAASSCGGWNGPAGELPIQASHGDDHEDVVVLALDTDGGYLWHAFYGSAGIELAAGAALDGSGNVYVVGNALGSWNGPNGEPPVHAFETGAISTNFVLKVDADGVYGWHTFFGGSGFNTATAIAVTASGDVYAAGYSDAGWYGPSGEAPLRPFTPGPVGEVEERYDAFLVKLGADGTYRWHAFFGSSDQDYGTGIALDGEERVYLTGASDGPWTGADGEAPENDFAGSSWLDGFAVALEAAGGYEWHTFWGSMDGDESFGVAIDGEGDLLFTGVSEDPWSGPGGTDPLHGFDVVSDTATEIFTLKLGPDGAYEWHTFYGADGYNKGLALAVDGGGRLIVTGTSREIWSGPEGQDPLHAGPGPTYESLTDLFVLALE